MKRAFRTLGVLSACIVIGGSMARADDALDLAKKLTSEGAAMISSKNASAITDTYLEDARVEVLSRNESTGGLNRDVRNGKTEIRKLYDELFKVEGSIEAKNRIEHARFVGTELLLITGTLDLTHNGETSAFVFVQIRSKQSGKWLLTSVEIFGTAEK